jgi:hypothetical protein
MSIKTETTNTLVISMSHGFDSVTINVKQKSIGNAYLMETKDNTINNVVTPDIFEKCLEKMFAMVAALVIVFLKYLRTPGN